MAEIGVLGPETPAEDVLLPSNLVTSVIASERVFPHYEIKIDGKTVQELGLIGYFLGLELEEGTETIPRLTLSFNNSNNSLVEIKAFKEGATAEVRIGYKQDQMVDHGKFIMDAPEFRYSNMLVDTLEFVGYSRTAQLAKEGQKQKVYENKKDSEIAQEIADYYQLDTDIKPTDIEFEHVIQSSETDLEFLRRRARLYGYQVYVDRDTLHYHPVKFVDSGKEIARSGGDSVVKELSLRIDTFLHALKVIKSQVEWERLRVLKEMSEEEDDKLFSQAKQQDLKLVSAKDIVGDPQPEWYLIGEGHLQDKSELKRQTEAFSKSSRWLATIEMKTLGLEFLRAGVVIRMAGMGRFDGPWLATKVVHQHFSHKDPTDSYVSFFTLKRSFSKDASKTLEPSETGSPNSDITSSLPSEGLVGVS